MSAPAQQIPSQSLVALFCPRLYSFVGNVFESVFLCALYFWRDRHYRNPTVTEFAQLLHCNPSSASRGFRRLEEKGFIREGAVTDEVIALIETNQPKVPVFSQHLEKVGGWHYVSSAILLQHVKHCTAKKDLPTGKLSLSTINRELQLPKCTIVRARDHLKKLGILVVDKIDNFCRWILQALTPKKIYSPEKTVPSYPKPRNFTKAFRITLQKPSG